MLHATQISVNDAHAASAAELFHARNKGMVWLDIIASRFHDHHEITLPLHIEQHLGLALAFSEERMQGIDCRLSRVLQWNANAQGTRKRRLGLFKGGNLSDRELGIGTLFNPHASAD